MVVSNGVNAVSATLCHTVAYLHFIYKEFSDPENWSANSQYLNPVDF